MRNSRIRSCAVIAGLLVAVSAQYAEAQSQTRESPWVLDVGFGIDVSVNGNVNSGAIGRLQGVATAILPQPWNRLRPGPRLSIWRRLGDERSTELRGIFTYQSADADLVRLSDFDHRAVRASIRLQGD
jgi:hypothetical protein